MKSAQHTLLLLMFLVLGGCVSRGVTLSQKDLGKPLSKLDTKRTLAPQGSKLKLLNVKDQREITDRIGTAKTGMLNKETPIRTDTPVDQFFSKKMETEFEVRGISSQNSTYGINFVLKTLWVSENTGRTGASDSSNCDISYDFEIIALKTNKAEYRGNIMANAEGTDNPLDTTSSNSKVLESCLLVATEKLFSIAAVQSFLQPKK